MKRAIVYCLALVVSVSGVMRGQSVDSQQISGTITDSTGAVISGATVTATNAATGFSKTVQSNSSGNYVVIDIPVGVYGVKVTMTGFKEETISGIHVDVGGKPSVPIVLQVGSTTERVEVQVDVVQMRTTSAETGAVITSEEATHLQLNGRNYIQLMTLAPGVSSTVASGFALFGTFGTSGNSQSVNGNRTDTSNYFIDGVDNKDNGGGGNNFVNISPDALEQFHTAASGYDASFGGSSGASVSVGLKSGTKDFHGLAYEYLRNNDIQAFGFQPIGTTTPVKPPLHYNLFGGTFGGPLFIPGHYNVNKDKLFFFVGLDFKRLITSTLTPTSVPSIAQRNSLPNCSATLTAGCSTANGRALVALFPLPNAGATTFNYLNINLSNTQEYLVKLDYKVNNNNQVSFHYVHDYYTSLGAPTALINFNRTLPGLTAGVQWTTTINAKTVNAAVASFSGNLIIQDQGFAPDPQFDLTSITRAGNGLTYNTLFGITPDIPSVTTTGSTALVAGAHQFNNYQRIYAGRDDLTRIIGNHNLKMGVYVWRSRKNQTSPGNTNGIFTFSSITNELEGNFTTYNESSAVLQVQARFLQAEGYFQDDWTVSRHLTLNLGLRYEYMPPIFSALANDSAFNPKFYDPTHAATVSPTTGAITANPYPYNGIVLPGPGFPKQAAGKVPGYGNPAVTALFHNLPPGFINPYFNTLAPRAGFSYDLRGNQSTVLHGGFGISYERVEGNYFYNSVTQAPFLVNGTINGGNVDTLTPTPAGTVNPAVATITNTFPSSLIPPRIFNWSFGFQQRLTRDTSAEVNYVGSEANNLTYINNINQAHAGTLQANPGVNANALHPYLGYGDIDQYTNGAVSNYHSVQARLLKRMRAGGSVSVSYTFSKNLTDATTYNYTPQDSFNLRGDYGPTNYNQPKILAVSYVYPLPFWQHGQNWYQKALGGWQVSGITRIASGIPINVTQAANSNTSGDLVTSVLQRPNLVGKPYNGGEKQYLNPIPSGTTGAAFAVPTAGTFGNLEAYGIKGPAFDNWDASLQKAFPIYEQLGLDFRAEMFNVPNHLSMFSVSNTMGAANFGQVLTATDPRTMEFALRLHF